MRRRIKGGALSAVTWAALGIAGCSAGTPASKVVTGTVTLGGKPLTGAGIRFFEPRIGQGIVANLGANGEYRTPSPLTLGTYQVSIAPAQPGGELAPGAPPPSPAPPDFVPKHYLNGLTSHLEVTLTKTTPPTFDFALTDAPLKVSGPSKATRRAFPRAAGG